MAIEISMRCENCRWWDNSVQLENSQADTTGACRVKPPTRDKRSGKGIWPFTEDVDWCASFVHAPFHE